MGFDGGRSPGAGSGSAEAFCASRTFQCKGFKKRRKEKVIIYADDGDYVLLKKAEELQIKTIPLSKFNQMILN